MMNEEQPGKYGNSSGRLDQAPDAIVKATADAFIEHFGGKNMKRAEEAARVLVEMRPGEAAYWAALALSLRELGRKVPALDAIRRSVELDASDREHLLLMAELLVETGKPIEGIELVQAVFDEGHDPTLSPAEQDHVTIRAGAILEGVQKGLEALEELRRSSPS